MSAVIERFLICDGGCGENFGVDNRDRTLRLQRRYARINGWVYRHGKDYCDECKSKPENQ